MAMDGKAGGSSPGDVRPLFPLCVAFRSLLSIYLDVYYVPGNSVLTVPNQLPPKGYTMGMSREAISRPRAQPWKGPEWRGAGRSVCGHRLLSKRRQQEGDWG